MSKRHGDPWMAQMGFEEVESGLLEGPPGVLDADLPSCRGLPHSEQNLASSLCGVSHFGHSTASSPYHAALAPRVLVADHMPCLTRSSCSRSHSRSISLNIVSALSR